VTKKKKCRDRFPEIALYFALHSLPFKDKFHADLTYAVAIFLSIYPFTSTVLSVGVLSRFESKKNEKNVSNMAPKNQKT